MTAPTNHLDWPGLSCVSNVLTTPHTHIHAAAVKDMEEINEKEATLATTAAAVAETESTSSASETVSAEVGENSEEMDKFQVEEEKKIGDLVSGMTMIDVADVKLSKEAGEAGNLLLPRDVQQGITVCTRLDFLSFVQV